jgi:hypothetical protein
MARNANENEIHTSKMAVGGHFEKNIKVVFWSEMVRNARKTSELQEPWSFYLTKFKSGYNTYMKKMFTYSNDSTNII